jgi:hypothetical protein
VEEAPIGRAQPRAAGPLAEADADLFAHTPAFAGARATDPVLHALIRLHDVLCELTSMPLHDWQRQAPDVCGTPELVLLPRMGQDDVPDHSTTSRS